MEALQVCTIEDMLEFCSERNMPLEQMRFFIGENYEGPRAFGIYRTDDGQVVVYKNKADGTRAIRYQGTDEAYAVSEIMKKLSDEIQLRNNKDSAPDSADQGQNIFYDSSAQSPEVIKHKHRRNKIAVAAVGIGVVVLFLDITAKTPNEGYYTYNDTSYYYLGGDWYYYDDTADDWEYYGDDTNFSDDYGAYYQPDYDYNDNGVSNFYDSDSYNDYEYDNDSWDYGDSYDSWDSGDTNWDSDW